MKKGFVFLIATIFCHLFIQAQKANMIFFTPNEEPFFLVVNGIQQNGQAMSNVKITDMTAPMQYQVRIKFADAKLGIINDKVFVEPDTEKSWSIQSKKKKGSSDLEYVIKNAGETDLVNTADQQNFPPSQVIVYHTEPLPGIGGDGVSFNMNVNEQGFNVNVNSNGGGRGTHTTTTVRSDVTNTNGFTGGCRQPLAQFDFRNQLERVRVQNTAAGKKLVAQKIAQQNCLTSRQVFELCDALTMNADKMDLAKFCYLRCFDPQYYEEVYKAMPTNTMVKELDDYITKTAGATLVQTQTTATNPNPFQVEHVAGYRGPFGCPQPMDINSFVAAKNAINDASFEDTKVSTAKTIIGNNCVTTDQLAGIIKLFEFEDTKLSFAKYAYTRTYDKGNYFKLNQLFTFDSSKEELNRFVQNSR